MTATLRAILLATPLALTATAAAAPTQIAATPAAAQTSGAPGELTITARDQPVSAFLRDLFGRVGRPVVTSPNLSGTVNGVFRGSINKIYSDIAKAFNLVSYDDGAALYVYSANEVTVQTLTVGRATAQRVARQVAAQRLVDRRNYVRVTVDGNLVASGTPRFIQQVTTLAQGGGGSGTSGGPVAQGDGGYGGVGAPAVQPLEFRVFYLRYARADDTLTVAGGREVRVPGLATILQNLVLDQRPGGSALGGTTSNQIGARLVRQSQPRLKGYGLDAVPPTAGQSPLAPSAAPYAQSEVLGYGGDVGAPLTSDVVRIEPNPYLNAIIVRDVPERMAAYDSLIRALDVEPQIIEVEATIIDIDTNKARALGINWRFSSGGFGFLLGSGDEAADGRLSRTPGSRRDNVDAISPSGRGGTISTIIGDQREFLGRVTALETKGVARIVSRPQVMTLSNVEAVFDRTSTFYVRVAGREEVDLFNVTAGTVLRVNPHVFRDQDQTRIRMLVNIEDGTVSSDEIENIPIVERASVSTQGMVLDGESLLLGGMTVDADRDDIEKIPLLGDIPVLGNLFKTQNRRRRHVERLFLITPRLVSLGGQRAPAAATSSAPQSPSSPTAITPRQAAALPDGSVMR